MPEPATEAQPQPQGQSQSESQSKRTKRFRAAKACRRCNEKRVKCDAIEHGIPCTRCEQGKRNDCALIQSRRGIYQRKKNQNNSQTKTSGSEKEGDKEVVPRTSSPPSQRAAASHDNNTVHVQTQDQQENMNSSRNSPNHLSEDEMHSFDALEQAPPSTALTTPASHGIASPGSGDTEMSNSSYREISWTTMFDHFLEGPKHGEAVIDKCSITYLGESFPLSIVLKDLRDGGKQKLHYPGPPCPENDASTDTSQRSRPEHMLPEDIAALEAKGTFEAPEKSVLDALVSVFLDRVFPLYPIVNRHEFQQQHLMNKIPWILLHAMCFISATYCPLSILHRAGFSSRKQARFLFYRKSKALFDNGYEVNKLVVLQSVIFLTFWGGGPNNYWNFYSWIGTGVTIAETLGIHRSMATTNMKPQDRSLLKRIWWILIIRDTSCAALVGRPFRINLEQCDTDPLTAEDFEHDGNSPDFMSNPQRPSFANYQIQMSKLSLVLREIVNSRFSPQKPNTTSAVLHESLSGWRAQLPHNLRWSDNSTGMNIFSSTLAILYNHHLILTHLNRSQDGTSINSDDISQTAAQRISTMACKIVTKSDVLLMPHELFHGIFLAEVVFYTQMKSAETMVREFSRAALNNCQMVLHESRESWDPSPWVMQLFDNLLRGAPDAENADMESPTGMAEYAMGATPGFLGAEEANFGYDPWQTHPMLSNLFEMPFDPALMGDGSMFPNLINFPSVGVLQ